MWDNEGDEALFDQEGNFRDQEAFEAFVEGYRPHRSFHADEVDDLANTLNVDFEPIGDSYLGEGRYVFDADFEAAASSIWYFGRLLVPRPVTGTSDFEVRAPHVDFSLRSSVEYETGHPETCTCPACYFAQLYDGVTPPYLGPSPSPHLPTSPGGVPTWMPPRPADPPPTPSAEVRTQPSPLYAPINRPPDETPVAPAPADAVVGTREATADAGSASVAMRRRRWLNRLLHPRTWLRRRS